MTAAVSTEVLVASGVALASDLMAWVCLGNRWIFGCGSGGEIACGLIWEASLENAGAEDIEEDKVVLDCDVGVVCMAEIGLKLSDRDCITSEPSSLGLACRSLRVPASTSGFCGRFSI